MREDWTAFRTVSGLCQKAGVAAGLLRRLVVKELVDNALDAAGDCDLRFDGDGFYYVEDDGPGIDPGLVGKLFSIRRPLASSKLRRQPSRGMLGNGLRVVAGAVLASGGVLRVRTRGQYMRLTPTDTGDTAVEVIDINGRTNGTCVEVWLGDGIPHDASALSWGEMAIRMAQHGTGYRGKPSAHCHDDDSWFEVFQAAGQRTAREALEGFDGLAGAKAGKVAVGFQGRRAASLSRDEAAELLSLARQHSKAVTPKRLGAVGREAFPSHSYAKHADIFTRQPGRGEHAATIPYVVEAWARVRACDTLQVYINRTPITGEIHTGREKNTLLWIYGCGLSIECPVGRKRFELHVNIIAPHIPLKSDGKAPDLGLLWGAIGKVVVTAVRAAARRAPSSTPATDNTQKAAVLGHLDEAMGEASYQGRSRYSERGLYYAMRTLIDQADLDVPTWKYFQQLITSYEEQLGHDLPGMFRQERGKLYHPHLRTEIPLGTRMVEQYERPVWAFNKVLYVEKLTVWPKIVDMEWPERHDCLLLTSQGFATRAARDLLDLLGDTDEEITFYCIHDADAYGTRIYQCLQEATRARPARRVKIVNLGLEPDEAVAMDLPVERVDGSKRSRAAGGYVSDKWRRWLQDHRVELDSIPDLIGWLDAKMIEHDAPGKVVPPTDVLRAALEDKTRERLREQITDRILREANIDGQLRQALDRIVPQIDRLAVRLDGQAREHLARKPTDWWRDPVETLAGELARDAEHREGTS